MRVDDDGFYRIVKLFSLMSMVELFNGEQYQYKTSPKNKAGEFEVGVVRLKW